MNFGAVLFGLVVSEIMGRKNFSAYAKYVISQKILMVALALGLFYVIGYDGVLIGLGLSFLPYAIIIYRSFKELKVDFSLIRTNWKFIQNSYILDLSNSFIGAIDKIIIGPFFGFLILGNYHLAIQFLLLLYILPNIFYNYLLPQDSTGQKSHKIKIGAIMSSVLFALLGILVGPIVLPIFFAEFAGA